MADHYTERLVSDWHIHQHPDATPKHFAKITYADGDVFLLEARTYIGPSHGCPYCLRKLDLNDGKD